MKSIKIKVLGISCSLAIAVSMLSCTKSFDEKTTQHTDFSNSSFMQVYMATVGATRNYVYVNGKPVTGAALTLGTVFPSIGYAANVTAGVKSFLVRDTLTTSTQMPLSFAQNFDVSKNYTIFMYDTTTSPKQKTVETKIVIPSDTSARIRFANFPYNPVALPSGFDIYSARRQANIFTNVQLTDVTEFIPYATNLTDTFYIRPTGTTTNLQNLRPTPAPATMIDITAIFTPRPKRSYTLVFRGGFRSATTTIATVRTLSVFTNF